MQMFQGVLSLRVSAVLDRVNMTIWKGTTIEKTISRFIPLDRTLWTRVRYQPHMEQQSRIKKTLVTVMTRLYKKLDRKFILTMP